MTTKTLTVDILVGSFGCSSCDHAGVDPYTRNIWAGEDWNECARGDGRCYGGVLETITQRPGETAEELLARAEERAAELDRELACSRCY